LRNIEHLKEGNKLMSKNALDNFGNANLKTLQLIRERDA
jgi:hypothetical protein